MIFSTRCALLVMGASIACGMALNSSEQTPKEAQYAYVQAVVSGDKNEPVKMSREEALRRLRADLEESRSKQERIKKAWQASAEAVEAQRLKSEISGSPRDKSQRLQGKQSDS